MISMKEYAKQKGITYEAVRKQVSRYKEELEGHISKSNRTQYLDDEAVAFLDKKRAESPIIIMEQNKDDEILRLQDENKALLLKVAELQDALIHEKDRVQQLQDEKIALLEEQKVQLLAGQSETAVSDPDEPERKQPRWKKWFPFWK